MSNTMMTQATDIHESLRHLFEGVAGFDVRANANPAPLPEGDVLWIDQDETRVEAGTEGDEFRVIRVFDLSTGEQVNAGASMGMAWWAEQMGDWPFQPFARFSPNTYVANGKYLFVSGGSWVRILETDEFVSWHSARARFKEASRAERDAWLAEHSAAVAQVLPTWADPALTWLDLMGGDVDSIEFRRDIGTVAIEQVFSVEEGAFAAIDAPEIRITIETRDIGTFDARQAARVSADLAAAAAILSEVAIPR